MILLLEEENVIIIMNIKPEANFLSSFLYKACASNLCLLFNPWLKAIKNKKDKYQDEEVVK